MSSWPDLRCRLEMAAGHRSPLCLPRTRQRLDPYHRSCDANKAFRCGSFGCLFPAYASLRLPSFGAGLGPSLPAVPPLECRGRLEPSDVRCQGACLGGRHHTAALYRELCWRTATQPAPQELLVVMGLRPGRPWHPARRCQVPTLGRWHATYGHHRALGARGARLNLAVVSS